MCMCAVVCHCYCVQELCDLWPPRHWAEGQHYKGVTLGLYHVLSFFLFLQYGLSHCAAWVFALLGQVGVALGVVHSDVCVCAGVAV